MKRLPLKPEQACKVSLIEAKMLQTPLKKVASGAINAAERLSCARSGGKCAE